VWEGKELSKRWSLPKNLIKLFHLLLEIPFLPDEEIAEELGVKADVLIV